MTPIQRLSTILDILRKECPWDRAQTLESIRYLTIEEVYELSDAIINLSDSDPTSAESLKKELGDILMHVLFYSKIAEDRQLFSFDDVCNAVSDKLVQRHPHIALPLRDGTMRPPTTATHPGWEQVKMKEGRKSVLEGVPSQLPSLVKSVRLQEKAEGIGFQVVNNDELRGEKSDQSPQSSDLMAEAGDRLFNLVREIREQGINPDEALTRANNRFMQAVQQWEQGKR